RQIIATRQYFQSELLEMGFQVVPTATNFAFFKATPQIPAELLTQKLKEHGILVRHYGFEPRIKDYVRVTIGTRAEMELVVRNMKAILEEYAETEAASVRKVS
ncbi:MAG: aminotransferase class I/II-fold pyridoxal phosphate-dependent enzyme, partial [Oribacterium sp.]|nr:aminotransferase class I/II-fold pyridoxal phosphate-dependent enzyme [Oribacterium sp.]